MPLNAIGRFVETKSFGLDTGITGILNRLRVNDDEARPFRLFLPVLASVHVASP